MAISRRSVLTGGGAAAAAALDRRGRGGHSGRRGRRPGEAARPAPLWDQPGALRAPSVTRPPPPVRRGRVARGGGGPG
ncbi:hypothetical protein ACU686_41010 [Yinghuangia aomiensis]